MISELPVFVTAIRPPVTESIPVVLCPFGTLLATKKFLLAPGSTISPPVMLSQLVERLACASSKLSLESHLPPLMFTEDEVEALVLGSRFVVDRGDPALAKAARSAMGKIASVLPSESRLQAETSSLLIGPAAAGDRGRVLAMRTAIRGERKLTIGYRDLADRETKRTIWPFALGFFDRVQVVVAHCELRDAIRHFRLDRILAAADTGERYPRRRHDLMKAWRRLQAIDATADEN